MASIIDIAKRAKAYNIDQTAEVIVKRNFPLMRRLNEVQLLDGEKNNGSEIAPEYASRRYASKKNQQNPRPGFGTPDLHLKGGFFKFIDGRFNDVNVEMYNSSILATYPSIKQYGTKVWGLQKDNIKTIQKANTEELYNDYKTKLGL